MTMPASDRPDHPYRRLPAAAYWRRAVLQQDGAGRDGAVDPVAGFPAIAPADRIATAGSCFAQHIARHLAAAGYRYMVTETAHPIVPPDVARDHGYGLFTARYGNIYTSRQLVQLFDRAYGRFVPAEAPWPHPGGGVADPFRPTIEPAGFASEAEMRADRARHLACVRTAFETLDLFVFTLGLTECWVSAEDGAAFPLCPGVAAGTFDPARHRFVNLRVADVVADLTGFMARLRAVNPGARMLLTVSPVPLAATAVPGAHVLAATTLSKSVLRAAAQEVTEDVPGVGYFPSYEMITGPQARGRFFADDLRQVTEAGVAHVMATFLRHARGGAGAGTAPVPDPAPDPAAAGDAAPGFDAAMRGWVATMCDEAMLDPDTA